MTAEQIIIFYATKYCPDCYRARKTLDARSIAYKYVDINRDPEARAYVEQVNHGNRSVPTILFPDGEVLVEPSNSTLNAKLDALN
jgi:mycoredoxin